jgi:hypothetical protein
MDRSDPIDSDSYRDKLLESQRTFNDADDAYDVAETLALQHGFSVSITKSEQKKRKRVDIRCFKSGKNKAATVAGAHDADSEGDGTEETGQGQGKKRKASSKKTNCPFLLRLRWDKERNCWHWGDNVYGHNHDMIPSVAIPAARRLEERHLLKISSWMDANLKPKHMRDLLIGDEPTLVITMQDIYNAQDAIKKGFLAGRTPTQAFLDYLEEHGFFYDYQEKDGKIVQVFWMHPESLRLWATYWTVLVVDNTYKTNQYGLPLMDVVGVASTGQTFVVFNALLSGESQENYTWAFERARAMQTFPRILDPEVMATDRDLALMNSKEEEYPETKNVVCIWHINKNMAANCKRHFDGPDWETCEGMLHQIAGAPTPEDYHNYVAALKAFCTAKKADAAFQYIETWLCYADRFVRYHIDQHRHLGETSSSRAEGSHFSTKSYLPSSMGNLLTLVKAQTASVTKRNEEILSTILKQRSRHYGPASVEPVLVDLLGMVSDRAFDMMLNQIRLSRKPDLGICTGAFTRTMGLPCKHTIASMGQNKRVQLQDIHPQWYIHAAAFEKYEGISLPTTRRITWAAPPVASLPSSPVGLLKTVPPELHRVLLDVAEGYEDRTPEQRARLIAGVSEAVRDSQVMIESPEKITSRGRPKGSSASSTKRDPSAFERAEKEAAKATRKCGKCHQPGHDRRTCSWKDLPEQNSAPLASTSDAPFTASASVAPPAAAASTSTATAAPSTSAAASAVSKTATALISALSSEALTAVRPREPEVIEVSSDSGSDYDSCDQRQDTTVPRKNHAVLAEYPEDGLWYPAIMLVSRQSGWRWKPPANLHFPGLEFGEKNSSVYQQREHHSSAERRASSRPGQVQIGALGTTSDG